MITEKHIDVAHKMFQCRRDVIALIGIEAFKKKVAEYKPIIERIQKEKGCTIIQATMDICKTLHAGGHDRIHVTLAVAACVEIMEPTEPRP